MLILTAWAVLAGTQEIRNVGDLAWFGTLVFQILAPFQLALVLFFSALLCASAVCQEKDRRTLILLLMTDLSNGELVLGKLAASLLNVLVLLVAGLPLFCAMVLLGGVDLHQILRVFVVTLLTAVVAGSLGSTIALWRDKTFQTLALSLLVLVAWLGLWEAVARTAASHTLLGLDGVQWATAMSPWRAIIAATYPAVPTADALGWIRSPVYLFLITSSSAAMLLNAVAIWRVRQWNPSREILRKPQMVGEPDSIFSHDSPDAPASVEPIAGDATTEPARIAVRFASQGKARTVWTQPVLWREMRTWAYGRKVFFVRFSYLVLFALAAFALHASELNTDAIALVMVPLFLLSFVLINAQAVTSLSTERDAKTLDLLLVTDISPREFVLGKLAGVFYNTKEMVLLPLLLTVYLAWIGRLGGEHLAYLLIVLLVMNLFVAMLGVHAGLIHANSRTSIGASLGTVFFLFLGIATCMRIMVAFSDSFQFQLMPFAMVMLGGGVGLFVSLGARNASSAIFLASFICPFATFYAITSYLLGNYGFAFMVTVATYSFATVAMLVPAIGEFDVASGRTSDAGE
ncbi:MAG: ABC transporter permease subunit [Pirellulales bacterium]